MRKILHADQRLKQNHKEENLPTLPQELYLLGRELGLILNHKKYLLSDYSVSKKLINLLRHGSLHRENDGAIEFWRIKDYHQDHFCVLSSWVWRKVEEQHGRRRRKQENTSVLYWFFRSNSFPPSSPRSFRTQSHWSFITVQCINSEGFLQVHFITSDVQSIYIPSSIPDWYREVKIWITDRQYSFCLWILWTKNTRILRRST